MKNEKKKMNEIKNETPKHVKNGSNVWNNALAAAIDSQQSQRIYSGTQLSSIVLLLL